VGGGVVAGSDPARRLGPGSSRARTRVPSNLITPDESRLPKERSLFAPSNLARFTRSFRSLLRTPRSLSRATPPRRSRLVRGGALGPESLLNSLARPPKEQVPSRSFSEGERPPSDRGLLVVSDCVSDLFHHLVQQQVRSDTFSGRSSAAR
jgi:hypothetical protein